MQHAQRGRRPTAARSSPWPHVVAHRGFSAACPENTMPAFAAATSLGADELELDVWPTADGELAVIHDPTLDRTADRTGDVRNQPWEQVRAADVGVRFGDAWAGVRIPCLDDVLGYFRGRIGFNVHVKDAGEEGHVIRRVRDLAQRHGVTADVYITGDADVLQWTIECAPEFERCCAVDQNSWNLVDNAVAYGCARLQFVNAFVDADTVARAHDAGLVCNLFYSDDTAEATRYFELGIDAMLTNVTPAVLAAASSFRESHARSNLRPARDSD